MNGFDVLRLALRNVRGPSGYVAAVKSSTVDVADAVVPVISCALRLAP